MVLNCCTNQIINGSKPLYNLTLIEGSVNIQGHTFVSAVSLLFYLSSLGLPINSLNVLLFD